LLRNPADKVCVEKESAVVTEMMDNTEKLIAANKKR